MKTIIEIFLQTVLAFFTILFFARIIGKKQISELTFYDYINGITFGSIAANMASDINQRTWQHLIGLALFAILTILMQFVSLKNRTARKVIEGEPTILIHNGHILENNMKKTRFNVEDLLSELRENKIFDIRDVEFAILETNGKLSVMPVPQKKPVTPQDMSFTPPKETIPSEIIVDGKIIEENLKQNGLTREWLEEIMKQNNINKPEEVILAIYNPLDQSIHFDLKKDNLNENTIDISE